MAKVALMKRAGLALALSGAAALGTSGVASAEVVPAAVHLPAGVHVPAGARVLGVTTTKYGTLVMSEVKPSSIRPDSDSGCTGSDPTVCFAISGSGQYVNYMEVDIAPGHTTTVTGLIKYAPNSYIWTEEIGQVDGGSEMVLDWFPDGGYVSQLGTYCGGAIINNVGTYACEPVSN